MKQTIKIITSLLLAVMLLFCFVSCKKQIDTTGLWENAIYRSDTGLGSGANTVKVEVTAAEQTVIFTIKTDKATLGEALFEHELVNDPSFFDTCNGIKADWNKDKAYWTFYVNDERVSYGIGDAKASTSTDATYRIVYTK